MRLTAVLLSTVLVVPSVLAQEHHHEEPPPPDRWVTSFHGHAFLVSNRQGGPSGGREFESANHFMLTSERNWGGGKLSLLGMFTLEPFTFAPEGSPLLFQRGETYHGVLLIDRQHPHELIAGLGAAWERPLWSDGAIRFYAAPRGEPAIGPPVFLHRLSASENPSAPLAHHNQDSTHIVENVVTVGVLMSQVDVEGSAFHGREPDENRLDLDGGAIDSYSGRVTYRPIPELSVQVSAAHLEHPEELEEGDQTRRTGSVMYIKMTDDGFIAASLILGENELSEGKERGNGLEATWKFRGKNFVFGRLESVDRDLYELIHKQQRPDGVPLDLTKVTALTVGYTRGGIPGISFAETGIGAQVTGYDFDSVLDPVYDSNPLSFQVFLRFRFAYPPRGAAPTTITDRPDPPKRRVVHSAGPAETILRGSSNPPRDLGRTF